MSYAVKELFLTLQGEGPFTGQPAVFIRLAGCNLQCPGCDTLYTSGRETTTAKAIADRVKQLHTNTREQVYREKPLVVITGGEPFRQNISLLVFALILNGFRVQVETNGTIPVPPELLECSKERFFIVCSPKTGTIHKTVLEAATCLKYVARRADIDPNDGLPNIALEHPNYPRLARPPEGWDRPIYLQPMDEQNSIANVINTRACVMSCLKFGYTLQLQTHKYLGLE